MNKKEECAIFRDLYELYLEEDLEQESMKWMEKHEKNCGVCLYQETEKEPLSQQSFEDQGKILSIRIVNFILYSAFMILSIWMSVWYFW